MAVDDPRPVLIFFYKRISNDPEGKELGVGRQDADLRAWQRRVHPDAEVRPDYYDNDLSASTQAKKERPRYKRLLRDAREAAVSGVYRLVIIAAYTTSRLTRDPGDNEVQIRLGRDCGVKYAYLRSPELDLSTAAGRQMSRLLAAQDAAYPEQISELVQREKEQAAAEGRFDGGPAGFGYRLVYDCGPSGKQIVPGRRVIQEDEAELIRDGAERLLAGAGDGDGEKLAAIARAWSVVLDREVDRHFVRKTLYAARTAGFREVQTGHRTQFVRAEWGAADPETGEWGAILPEGIWRAVRAKVDANKEKWSGGHGRRWLGSGIYRCGRPGCDSWMQAAVKYRCRRYGHCVIQSAETVDALVRERVAAILAEHGVGLLAGSRSDEVDRLAKEAIRLRGRLAELDAAFDNDEEMTARAYGVQSKKLEARLAKVEAKQAGLRLPDMTLHGIADAEDPARAFLDAPLARQREILRVVAEVTILPGARGGSAKGGGKRPFPAWRVVIAPKTPVV